MLIEGIQSINESIQVFNNSLDYNDIFFQNLDYSLFNLNTSFSKNEDKDLSNNNFPFYHIISFENYNMNNNEGISTEFLSKQKQNSKDFNEPLLYSFENILNIFNKKENKDRFKEIIDKKTKKSKSKNKINY